MLLALAWRNVWRNARRSLITMSALAVGVAGIVGLYSYREAFYEVMVKDITSGLVGHLQVHGRGYQEAPSVSTIVAQPQQVEAVLRGALPGAKTERRVIGAGLAGSAQRSAPVMMLGLEKQSGLYKVTRGGDLGAPRAALVGEGLAAELELAPGAELVLVSQAADGSMANDRYSVAGVFTSASAGLDSNAVVLSLAEAQDFFALGQGVHQLVVQLPTEEEDLTPELTTLRAALDLQTLEALSWSELLPELKTSMDTKRRNQHAMDFIILLIVGLGVFNAMSMSVFERTHELGVLASLGTRPRRLLAMILLEALWQGVIAFAVGTLLAVAFIYGLGELNLGDVWQGDVMGVRMPGALSLRLFPGSLVGAGLTAFFTALLGALLPALRAMRLQPVEALRHT